MVNIEHIFNILLLFLRFVKIIRRYSQVLWKPHSSSKCFFKMMAYSRVRHLIHSCPLLCSWHSLHVQEAAARNKSLFLNPNRIDVPFSRARCPDANLILQCACEMSIFCGSTDLDLFPLWGTRRGEDGSKRDFSLPPSSQTGLFLLPWLNCFLLVSHEHSCSVALSVWQLLGTHACAAGVCWQGALAILMWESSEDLTFLVTESAALGPRHHTSCTTVWLCSRGV